MIPFNKPHLTGKETHYIYEAVNSGKISGNGIFTKKCQAWFEQTYGFKKALLTTSCTDALEMAAILVNIQPGDEVIIPSYTFVSTAIAFVREGAKIVFADSCFNNPNIDANVIESLITPKTKAIVPVHYAGVACDMEKTIDLSLKNNDSIISFNAKEHDYAQLLDLCFLSGKFSRFRIDSKIPSTKFEALYKLWIDNSINKTFAFDTLIKITENNISGFITIKKVNQDVSEIGLIAVNTNYQGRGIASELLNQAQYISLKNGFKTIRVPTQYDNKPAINLYQKTGFQIVNTTFVYHYWNI